MIVVAQLVLGCFCLLADKKFFGHLDGSACLHALLELPACFASHTSLVCCMPRLFDMPARIAQTSIYLTTNTFPHSTARLYDTKTQEVRSLRFIPNPCA